MTSFRLALFALVATLAAVPPGSAPDREPLLDKLTIIAPGSAGGGWDQTALAMREVLLGEGLVREVAVVNRPGAGGTIGLAEFVNAHRGDGNALIVGGLFMVNAIRANRAAVSLSDTTPIARITGEYEVIAVPAGSELHSLDDLIQALRVNPGSVAWAGGSGGGTDQILINQLARAIGVEPVHMTYVPFSGGADVEKALLQHEVSAGVSGWAEFSDTIADGRILPLAISSEHRLPGIAIPTLREQGIDITLSNWRGLFAPPAINQEQQARLATLVDAMARSAAWREVLRGYRWTDLYLAGAAFTHFMATEQARAATGPDPRGTRPAKIPEVVWTSGMWISQNRFRLGALLIATALGAIGYIAWQRAEAARRERDLALSLAAARQEAARRGAETQDLLRGLGEQIDRQFGTWGLTAAEREVALLMLKGLRHKEIASVRNTSERTVRQQALAIYKKAKLDGRTDLAAFFLEDLLQPGELAHSRRSA